MVSIIAAIGTGRTLGKNNDLLWRIPDDLKRFKALTTGHPIIMGRKTFDSIISSLGKPLPNRTSIVVTRNPADLARVTLASDIIVCSSLEEAIAKAKELDSEVFVIGGGQIYEQALPFADRLCLTLIDDTKEADTYFPAYEDTFTKVTFQEDREYEGLKYKWLDLERA
jgi:dihydrofolate reductase